MNHNFSILLIVLLATLSLDCSNGAGAGLTIQGTIKNAGNMQVYLDKIGINPASPNLVIGKADLDNDGKFKVSFPELMTEGLYRLRIGEQKINLILDGSESNIQVNGDLGQLSYFNYTLEGSKSSSTYLNIVKDLMSRQSTISDVKAIVDTTANPFVGMLITVQATAANSAALEIHQKALERVETTYPGSSYVTDYKAYIASVQQAAANIGGATGYRFLPEEERKPAPEIKLPNPNGKQYALSQLRGKVVLLDFWASWCGPCRRENPNVVNVYNKYKDKGFTIYSVSLDGVDSRQSASLKDKPELLKQLMSDSKNRWEEAIQQDGLSWDYHVSDLKKWECEPARIYGVNSIPRTFMIDKEGRIAALNLRGAAQIEETLLKLL